MTTGKITNGRKWVWVTELQKNQNNEGGIDNNWRDRKRTPVIE